MTSTPKTLFFSLIIAAFVGNSLAQDNDKSDRPKITISKETTWVTQPLKPDGTVDYVAARNKLASRGVTPENNLAIALAHVVPVEDKLKEHFAVAAKVIGINQIDVTDQHRLKSYPINTPQSDAIWEATKLPWREGDYPEVAEWIETHSAIVDKLIAQLDQRNKYFVPALDLEDDQFSVSTEVVWREGVREIIAYLEARAMLRLGKSDISGCREDLIAMLKICRTISTSAKFDFVFASGQYKLVMQREMQILLHPDFDEMQLEAYRNERKKLAPQFKNKQVMNEDLRLHALSDVLRAATSTKDVRLYAVEETVMSHFKTECDVDVALKRINAEYDRLVNLYDQATFEGRIDAFAKDHDNHVSQKLDFDSALTQFAVKHADPNLKGKYLGAAVVIGHQYDWFQWFRSCAKSEIWFEMGDVYLALLAYRFEHRQFPATLDKLVPTYLNRIPIDPFSGQPIKYIQKPGYIKVYSFGYNWEDDGGKLEKHYGDHGLTSDPDEWNLIWKDD